MFHTLDPAPFHEKDLDETAAAYLLEACQEASSRRRLRLVVHLPASEAESDHARTPPEAVHHYFAYRERQLRTDLIRLLRYEAVSLALRRALVAHPPIVDRAIVDEGLLILGWVAMWRPIEILLYDWWSLTRRRALLRRLATIPVEIRTIE